MTFVIRRDAKVNTRVPPTPLVPIRAELVRDVPLSVRQLQDVEVTPVTVKFIVAKDVVFTGEVFEYSLVPKVMSAQELPPSTALSGERFIGKTWSNRPRRAKTPKKTKKTSRNFLVNWVSRCIG